MHGWTGRVLYVDVGRRAWRVEEPGEDVYHARIGGKGMAGWLLQDHITLAWHDPDMPLIFFTGPLVGTAAPTPGRMVVMSRSPLTGTICDSSVGGRLAVQLKKAGYDGLVITGKSGGLIGLHLEDARVRFCDASSLAGLSAEAVSQKAGPAGSLAVVGPAAENGVRFANIVVDNRYFIGRGGLGLVMAAKGLKYLAVRGTGKVPVYDKAELRLAGEEIRRLIAASPALLGDFGISHFGTGALYDLILERRMLPTRNFRQTFFPPARQMNAYRLQKAFGKQDGGCFGCHIRCKKQAADGGDLPEFETMCHFSSLLGNRDMRIMVQANRLCGEYGMDTISAGATLACCQELEDDVIDIPGLLKDMALSRGKGVWLKEGALRYAREQGRQEAAMTVKGLELPGYDPRGAYGMALAYVTSTRGGCHLRAYPIAHEILRKPVATDRFTFSGKARIIKLNEDANAMVDSLTACKFVFFAATLEEYARALYGATGLQTSGDELKHKGERVYYLERVMNAANGFSAGDDDLPARFFNEPGSSGDGIHIPPLDREEFLAARANYYRVRGLNADGMPTERKCKELGIAWKN